MILLDATALSLLLNPTAKPPIDPATNLPLSDAARRLAHLEAEVQRNGDTILIPTPALAEVLVALGDAGPASLERINKSSRFKIADFDQRAAIEVAAMTREAIRAGDKRGGSASPWQKVKIDRQIIAIARVHGAERVYSDDTNVASFGGRIGLKVIPTWEFPLPPEDPQRTLFSDVSTETGSAE